MLSVPTSATCADPAPNQGWVYFQKNHRITRQELKRRIKAAAEGGNRSPSCVTASERRAWPPRTTWRARRRTPTRVGTRLPPPLRSPSGCRGLRFGAGGTNPPGASDQFVAQQPTTAARSVQVEIQLPGSASRHGHVRHTGNRLPSPTGVHASRRAFILPTAHPTLPTRDGLCAGRTLLKGRRGIPAAPWQGHDAFHRKRDPSDCNQQHARWLNSLRHPGKRDRPFQGLILTLAVRQLQHGETSQADSRHQATTWEK